MWAPPTLCRDHNNKMHHREPFDAGSRRVMHRIQGKGDKPVQRADASRRRIRVSRGDTFRAAVG